MPLPPRAQAGARRRGRGRLRPLPAADRLATVPSGPGRSPSSGRGWGPAQTPAGPCSAPRPMAPGTEGGARRRRLARAAHGSAPRSPPAAVGAPPCARVSCVSHHSSLRRLSLTHHHHHHHHLSAVQCAHCLLHSETRGQRES